MSSAAIENLIREALAHEKGGVLIYETALRCVQDEGLRQEWNEYLEQTIEHVATLTAVCEQFGIDPDEMTPGCAGVEHVGHALVEAMELALKSGEPGVAELVACDCVVLAETKDHANWELIGACGQVLTGEIAVALQEAHRTVEEQEDEHLYHSKGWCRELRMQALGLEPVLPPPEAAREVKTAIGAARAEQQRAPSQPLR